MFSGGAEPRARAVRCARESLNAYMCALPPAAHEPGPKPPDWAFSDNPATVGKFVARWAMHLYLALGAAVPRRYVLPSAELQRWRWLPAGGCGGQGSAWFRRDVCAAGVPANDAAAGPPPPALHETAGGRRLLEIALGNTSGRLDAPRVDRFWEVAATGGKTAAGMWLAGQQVQRVRAAVGPCVAAAVHGHVASAVSVGGGGGAVGGGGGAVGGGGGLRATFRRGGGALTVAVHVRRGDACERWASRGDGATDSSRPCFAAAEYVSAAEEVAARLQRRAAAAASVGAGRRPTVRLLLASDSASALDELAAAARNRSSAAWARVEVAWLPLPRGAGWGAVADGANLGLSRKAAMREFIEARNSRGLVDRPSVLTSLFADLELLSRAHGFVGTAASFASRLALLAIVGERGAVPPFVMLDRPLGQLWFA